MSGAIGLAIGLVAGLCRLSKNPTLHDLSTIYVELVRGTPLLVQIFIFYFFIGTVLNLSREFCRGCGAGAVHRRLRGRDHPGRRAVHRPRTERGRPLPGPERRPVDALRDPAAGLQARLPPLAGQFISLVKDTSLVSVIAITELTKSGREAITTSFSTFEIWFCVAALYLLLNLPLSHMASRLERRLGQSGLKYATC